MSADFIAIIVFKELLPLLILVKFAVYGLKALGRGRV